MRLPSQEEKARTVRDMFDRIAPGYDRMNGLMTGGLDRVWRRRLMREVGIGAGDRVVDLGCGTGDLIELANGVGAHAIGVDPAGGMLSVARDRGMGGSVVQGDALAIPLADASVDVVTTAFALRNVLSIPPVFQESARILRPGGRIAILEVSQPQFAPARAVHSFYFQKVVPLVGQLLADRDAYRYLPASVAYLPEPPALMAMLEESGFGQVRRVSLGAGAVQLLLGSRLGGSA
jgi:demethylmenaquinone methyltransferase/2-methoxy-6-polyprenyl-1,4-benzoquinol methylase